MTDRVDAPPERISLSDGPQAPDQIEAGRRIDQAQDVAGMDAAEPAGPPQASIDKIDQFEQEFANKDGYEYVKADAMSTNWSKRVGADHQMNVAQELDGQVKSFEDPFHPKDTNSMNNVDIVTKDNYAVECKASWGDQASPSTVRSAYAQAERRLGENAEGKKYNGVAVVFPDGKLQGEAADVARRYEAANPNIRFCEKSQLNDLLEKMKQRKA